MGHKSFITRYVELVELYEIEYPDDFKQDKIAKYNEMLAEGIDIDDLPDDVSLTVISGQELYGERLEEWEKESGYMPVAEDMITTVKEYKYNLDQFLWHVENLSTDDYFKFIIYLAYNGYSGDEEEMFEEFHKKYYS